jgi:hypothetical protein
MAGGEDIVIVRPAPRDKFGDPTGDPAIESASSGWLVAPGSSTELHEGQNSVDSDVDLYRLGAPGSEAIGPADQIRVRGVLYEVVGNPAVWSLGTVIRLRKFTG